MTDDDLRARLRAADPAGGLEPLTPERTTRLLETTMTTTTTAAPPWNRRLMFALAAALLLIVGGVDAGLTRGTKPHVTPPPPPAALSVTRLTTSAGSEGKCRPPDTKYLSPAPLAFEGTVRSIDGGTVTLTVIKMYAGPRTDLVEVRQTDGNSETLSSFEKGETYLVAAFDGVTMSCGYTGVATPELRALYNAAF